MLANFVSLFVGLFFGMLIMSICSINSTNCNEELYKGDE